jgi:hypothetical protein
VLSQILPHRLDNTYRGHRVALWLFGVVVLLKTGIALGTIFNGRTAAGTADGVPLDQFGAAGAQAVIALFAIWGLAQLVMSVFGVLALTRYRAMVPFMFVLLLLEHLTRRFILLLKPIATTGPHPGSYINLAILGLMVVGLVLSLWRRADATAVG